MRAISGRSRPNTCDEQTYRGRTRRVWKQRYKDNHFLDCRVYNLSLLEYLGFSKMSQEDWNELAAERGASGERSSGPRYSRHRWLRRSRRGRLNRR